MRQGIFDIFKALRNFDVTAEEIDNVAKSYKFWLKRPIDHVINYNMVYYYKGVLYALPYPMEELKNTFIGIELHGVIYLAGYQCNVRQDKIAESLMWLKGKVFHKSSNAHYGIEVPNNIKLELPTGDEINTLVKKTQNEQSLNCVVFNSLSEYWITPDKSYPDETVVIISWDDELKYHRPTINTEAHIQPVIYPRTGIDFIGHLNYYGAPDNETMQKYCELLERIKH